jgi:hypothetical protein
VNKKKINTVVFSTNGAGITGYPYKKNELGPLPYSIYTN